MTSRWTGGSLRRTTRQQSGAAAERDARRYLEAAGLEFVAQNVRYRLGEIDLVMREGECLVFVEVRYRASSRFVAPLLTVDRHKERRITQAASLFLARNPRYASSPARFDVIAIERAPDGHTGIQWVRDAFRV
ncbi:MAG: YraN family protein [Gammaproteobacteria bacterium]|nr:YraN family protein [Gammaproteobacteria bacterium]